MHKIFISRISDGREVQGDIHFYKGSEAIFSGKGDVIEEMDKAEIIEHSKFKTVVQGIQKDTGESMTWNATAKSFWRDDITLDDIYQWTHRKKSNEAKHDGNQ